MDAPLWVHSPKLVLWALFEASLVFMQFKFMSGTDGLIWHAE
jgi:hypothetical protein